MPFYRVQIMNYKVHEILIYLNIHVKGVVYVSALGSSMQERVT